MDLYSVNCGPFFKRAVLPNLPNPPCVRACKKDVSYSVVHDVLAPLSCQFFPAIDCLQGAWSSKGHPPTLQSLDLAVSEGQLSLSQ